MQTKTILVGLLATLATSMPSPADVIAPIAPGITNVQAITSSNLTSVPGESQVRAETFGVSSADGVSANAVYYLRSVWQARGGCKLDWNRDRRCVNQCIGEANSKWPRWQIMIGRIDGGCFGGWRTCTCLCYW
ncbi:hypothetical protein QBC35DRAFT_507037 [Podospora australis]|uniref:Uncharacterized protein n=1 Tax=Podospora australis TaxID=1536484 RepID=A0AAN7AEQ9_9PEZI|nr:hypothetical protein QBC35DRAFT_507037 [Podospora australis]